MSEFKGTKGKWSVIKMDDTFIETDESNVCEIPHNGIYDYNELPYNALLISKAPEMLEMLIDIVEQENISQSAYDSIYELIKQATEL